MKRRTVGRGRERLTRELAHGIRKGIWEEVRRGELREGGGRNCAADKVKKAGRGGGEGEGGSRIAS